MADRRARHRPRQRVRVILALETSCDDTCAAVVTEDGEIRVQRDLVPGDPRPLRRRGPGDRLPAPPRADRGRASTTRSRRAECRARSTSTSSRSTAGRGSSRRCWSASRPPRRSPPRGSCRSPRVDHLHGHVAAELPGAGAVRAAVPEPDRERGAHAARARHRPRAGVRGARPDARRRRRRGVRQGRAAARAGVSRRGRRSSASPATAIRARSRSRPAPSCRASTSPSPG